MTFRSLSGGSSVFPLKSVPRASDNSGTTSPIKGRAAASASRPLSQPATKSNRNTGGGGGRSKTPVRTKQNEATGTSSVADGDFSGPLPIPQSYARSDKQLPTQRRQPSNSPRGRAPNVNTSPKTNAATPIMFINSAGESVECHPDALLLSSLSGPAVIATVAGVLRSPPKNPELVAFVLGNVHCLLGLDPTPENVKESLNNFEQFIQKCRSLDQASVIETRLGLLRQRQEERPESFMPDRLSQVSHACAKFAMWVKAVCVRAGWQPSNGDPKRSPRRQR